MAVSPKGARALPPANSHRLAHRCSCRPLERLARVAARPLSDVTVEPDAAAVAAALRGKPVTLTTALESEAVGGLPMEAGFYAWWFEAGTIAGVPHHPHPAKPELGLLYIGISPKRPSSSGLIRSRVVNQHVKGNTSSSTFRFVLASLLLDELGLRPRATIKKVVLIRTTTLACASGSSTTPA
jgi:GIY-YIG catalytic domain